MERRHIVFLTGAGISVESGLTTFRGKDGLWNNKSWRFLASTEGYYKYPQDFLDFYNWRRKKLAEAEITCMSGLAARMSFTFMVI